MAHIPSRLRFLSIAADLCVLREPEETELCRVIVRRTEPARERILSAHIGWFSADAQDVLLAGIRKMYQKARRQFPP